MTIVLTQASAGGPAVPDPAAADAPHIRPHAIRAAALIGPGIDIGPWVMIGMGAVVTRDVVPHALMIGAPARVAGWVCVCGTPLGGAAVAAPALCKRCSRRYRVVYGPRGRILSPLERDP